MPPASAHRRVVGISPVYNNGAAVAYAAGCVLAEMRSHGYSAEHWVPTSEPAASLPVIRNVVPPWLRRPAYRLLGEGPLAAWTERCFLAALRPGDLAHVWPGVSARLCERVKAAGAVLLLERINGHTAVARDIAEREAATMGVPVDQFISDRTIAEERTDLALADFVFAPSPHVEASLRSEGVAPGKIVSCSYGWSPARIPPGVALDRPNRAAKPLRVAFVGTICMRKGVHRLLEAWRLSGLQAELVLAGAMTAGFAASFGAALRQPGVRLLGHTDDIVSVYRDADVFVLPSFEEGDPLVTYEAMAAGLPTVVSPMGAGRIGVQGNAAIVLAPDDTEAWAGTLRRLAADPSLRLDMGRRAAARAQAFTWERAVGQRIAALDAALGRRASARPIEGRTGAAVMGSVQAAGDRP